MVTNVIMMKLKEKSGENAAALKATLLGMVGNIAELKALEVMENIRPGAAAYDIMMVARYDDMQAFNSYAVHPYHAGVGKYVLEVCDQIASFCYEESE